VRVGEDTTKCFHICSSDLHATQLEKGDFQVNRVNRAFVFISKQSKLHQRISASIRGGGGVLKTPVT
jgi:hypothetical protein